MLCLFCGTYMPPQLSKAPSLPSPNFTKSNLGCRVAAKATSVRLIDNTRKGCGFRSSKLVRWNRLLSQGQTRQSAALSLRRSREKSATENPRNSVSGRAKFSSSLREDFNCRVLWHSQKARYIQANNNKKKEINKSAAGGSWQ